MISLFPIERFISYVAVTYAIVTCFILWIVFDATTSLSKAMSIAIGGSGFLHILLFVTFSIGWRQLWRKFPVLNQLLFPDLNGTWEMTVHWEWDGKKGTSKATAVIKQNFLKIGMDVEAEDSESQTLIAKPKKDAETGRAELYYVFLTTPKHKTNIVPQEPYNGTAILKLSLDGDNLLRGNYFTSRKTVGHYELTRIDT